jgi:hypothetical protein
MSEQKKEVEQKVVLQTQQNAQTSLKQSKKKKGKF